MKTGSRPQRWLVTLMLAFLMLTPLLAVILGILYVSPVRAGYGPDLNLEYNPTSIQNREAAVLGRAPVRKGLAMPSTRQASPADIGHGSLLPPLDPHDNLHRFVLLPALAGMVILGGSLVASALLTMRKTAGPPGDRVAWLRYGLLGLLWWLALSLFLILDLAGSVSLYLGLTVIYALCWVLVGLVVLHPRPIREKLLVVILFAAVLLSIRLIDWNTRKSFLKDLGRVRSGTPVAQADELMGSYMKSGGTLTQVDEQGRIVSGSIVYRHTTEGWGNSDAGVLTIVGGRVVDVKFLPD
jgi:hypothetical protein